MGKSLFAPRHSRVTGNAAMSIYGRFDISSRDGSRWFSVDEVRKDGFGDVLFVSGNNVVRRVLPGALVNIRLWG